MKRSIIIGAIVLLLVVVLCVWFFYPSSVIRENRPPGNSSVPTPSTAWVAPDTARIPLTEEGDLIRYGKDLIVHTALYFGPRGKISRAANGLNCQNCHIDAGRRFLGNNFSRVASVYPQYRNRSGRYESMADRVNGCMERSLNGKRIDTLGREMKAFEAYFRWIGQGVPEGVTPAGAGTEKLPLLDRAADPLRGALVFKSKCRTCHGENGQGRWNADSSEYIYPPLWGPGSYNVGAGLYRISLFAGYVKNNMPFGTTHRNPQLTNEEAWDVAAFVNSQPRPYLDMRKDWPVLASKPMDYPFGPYGDGFSEKQHKYGPYKMMAGH